MEKEKENPNLKHSYDFVNDFDRKRGLAINMALSVENHLDFFISNYFIRPQNDKTFFFDGVVIQRMTFEEKIRLFEEICKREEFDKKRDKTIIQIIR